MQVITDALMNFHFSVSLNRDPFIIANAQHNNFTLFASNLILRGLRNVSLQCSGLRELP